MVAVDIDPLPAVVGTEACGPRRGPAVPRGGHERARRLRGAGARGLLRRLRGRRDPADRQPAGGAGAAGDPGRRGRLGRGRPGDDLVLEPGRADGEDGHRLVAGARSLAGAPDHPRRRRRVRGQDRGGPRVRARRPCRQARGPAGALGGEPLGEPARDAARPRPGPGRHHRRPARRHRGGLQPGHRPGCRRLPPVRGRAADAHHADGRRGVRVPEGARPGPRARHQHDARSVPTAAPAAPRRPRRSSGPSTCSPPRSGWTRPRCAGST